MLTDSVQELAAYIGGVAAVDAAGGASNIGNTGGWTVIAGDGAIPLTTGRYLLTKGSAAAITLAAPTAANAGCRITVSAGSNFAHVVTSAATNIGDGTVGLNTTITCAAFTGATCTIVCIPAQGSAVWIVESNEICTIAP